VQLGAQAILIGLEPRQACLARRFIAVQAVFALAELRWETKLHSTEETRHYGRAGEVFSREGTHATYTSRKNRLLGCARTVVARSEKRGARSEEQGARMIFRTKLDELGTRSKAGVGRGITEHLIL
jgi:hypothetical protein